MGMESYNFLLVPYDSQVTIEDDVVDYVGGERIPFSKAVEAILSIKWIRAYVPPDVATRKNIECYYAYSDGTGIVEIEINAGIFEMEGIEEISVRLAVTSNEETFKVAISICKILNKQLRMKTIDMRLGEEIDVTNDFRLRTSQQAFEKKKRKFYEMYSLPYNCITEPMNCGKAFFEALRGK
ncbi:hypothetical protein [Paenibacillus camerounensis]|uniref:hypothetical protein n=1 Tax=Paenibacillus camerounensis TaxID=1243663 RepID=UPI0005AAA865|nr:hypothetical protein [Paenibacillus camerounensis]